MYACMGAVIASAGMILPLHRFQNGLSIALGVTLLVVGIWGVRKFNIPGISSLAQRLSIFVKARFAERLKQKTRGAIFTLGVLNGMLPCGLTLVALTWCLTLRGPLDGFNFMMLFGVGTLPVMLGLTGILPALAKTYQWNIHRLTASMLIISGCLLIARAFIMHIPHEHSGDLLNVILCS